MATFAFSHISGADQFAVSGPAGRPNEVAQSQMGTTVMQLSGRGGFSYSGNHH